MEGLAQHRDVRFKHGPASVNFQEYRGGQLPLSCIGSHLELWEQMPKRMLALDMPPIQPGLTSLFHKR